MYQKYDLVYKLDGNHICQSKTKPNFKIDVLYIIND